jgi:hypothetical protein
MAGVGAKDRIYYQSRDHDWEERSHPKNRSRLVLSRPAAGGQDHGRRSDSVAPQALAGVGSEDWLAGPIGLGAELESKQPRDREKRNVES